MRIDTQIAALRDDPVAQRYAHEQLDQGKTDWLATPDISALVRELEMFSDGLALEQLHHLHECITHHSAAKRLTDSWQSCFAQLIQLEPLGHVPFKHNYSAGLGTIRLLESDRATLSLLVYEEVEQQVEPQTAAFSHREQYEIVIAGSAQGLLFERGQDDRGKSSVHAVTNQLTPGSMIRLEGPLSSRQITNVRGRLLVLQLSRAAENPQPIQEISLSDGALVHQASDEKRESQMSMAMAVLTEMGRADAAPVLADLSHEGPAYLRWDALRHTLALDPVRGFALLKPMAHNAQDELAEPARALRAQLAAAHPQLLQLEAEQCPA